MPSRYDAVGTEAEFQPGSHGRVLRNRLCISTVRELGCRESESLLAATQLTIDETRVDQRFTAYDVRRMHHRWLGDIFEWAGEYRSVNVAKGSFMFAAATQVPKLMRDFELGALCDYTPCQFESIGDQVKAIATVHAELILIHPFRDGNGRCARLLSVLMGLQSGLPPLDFGGIRGAKKRAYISAVHSALGRDYAAMIEVFRGVIVRTLKAAARTSSE